GRETSGDRPGPRLESWKPSDDAVGAEDPIEALAVEQGRGVIDVALHESRRDSQLGGQSPGLGDGDVGEIEARDPGSEPRPAQRVLAEVALEMKQRESADVADLLELDRPE